ncbi:MAG: cyclic nucleotide-binding domain-containing protein [Myxococcota bacterium]
MKDDEHDFTPVTRVGVRRVDAAELVLQDEVLNKCVLVTALGPERAGALLRLGLARRYPDKAVVFRQEEGGDSLFLVLRGETRLFVREGSDSIELGAVSKGEVFGEGEVLSEGGVRSSSVIAASELDVLELPRKRVREAAEDCPELLVQLQALRDKRQAALEEMASFLNRW